MAESSLDPLTNLLADPTRIAAVLASRTTRRRSEPQRRRPRECQESRKGCPPLSPVTAVVACPNCEADMGYVAHLGEFVCECDYHYAG